jgi:type VI secretion system protein ImpL
MRRSPKVWLFTALIAVSFNFIGIVVPRLIGLEGTQLWVLRGGLWFLGLIATILMFIWTSSKWKATPREASDADEIDITMAAARTRLAEARGKAAARFGNLPLMVVVGPIGSAKTTVVSRSGMEPELLAGEVLRGDSVMPTASVNVWYAQDNLVLEAGGPVASDAGRWRRLVKQIQPNRLAAALARGKQAPRVVVVCVGCDELLKPGAAQSVPATAQKLRARLGEMSQKLGIRLPVYVLFTKADRLPYFDEYVRSLTREEARDVLGVTLTVPPPGAAVGAYAEREARRLSEAFNVLFRGLAGRRLDLLQREAKEDIKAGVYEFPREFRKVTDLATQFLLDLCRPSQLGVSPFLRGFYFTGVRPVWIHDVGVQEPEFHQAETRGPAIDATGVFDPRMLQQQQAAPKPSPGSRKVPEWTFLERVFRDILLRDGAARGITGGGTRVNFLRRAMLAGAASLALVFSIGFTWSFFSNRGLLDDTRRAVDGARELSATTALPDLDTFQRLDTLRAQAALLGEYSRARAPLGLSWMLYAGNRVQPPVRQLYFQRFGDIQWQRTRASLVQHLRLLPAAATDASAYDATYDALRAYIATSSRPDRAASTFLTPTLMGYWTIGIEPDPERLDLATNQFDFFADELPWGQPFDGAADSVLVDGTRRFLRGFAGGDQLYRVLLASVSDSLLPVRWTGPLVSNDVVVPAAYTRQGWERAQEMLSDVPRLFDREDWVVGESAVSVGDREQLAVQLRERYESDFVDQWQRFLSAGSVPRFTSPRDAATKLDQLATNDSPLLQMLGIVADNTAVDSAVDTTVVGEAFRPVLDIVPANATTVTETAGGYLNTLVAMKNAFQSLANATGPLQAQALGEANTSSQQVKTQVGQLQRSFSTEGEARETGVAVAALLQMPAVAADGVIGDAPAAAVNAKGGAFCSPFGQFSRQFPFNPSSPTDATVDDVAAVLSPGTGALWSFYQSDLSTLIVQQGSRWAASPGASPQPTPQFVDFFSRAAQASAAMFNANGAPEILFTLRIETSFEVPEVTVTIAGRPHTYTRSSPAGPALAWNGTSTGARIEARVGNAVATVADVAAGPWSVFRLFYQAEMSSRGAGRYGVTWRVPGSDATITGELSYAAAVPIFQRGWLTPLGQCVTRIAR